MDSLTTAIVNNDESFAKGVDSIKSGTNAAVRHATALLYKAAYVQFIKHEQQLRNFWEQSHEMLPTLYRLIRGKKWPPLARTSVLGTTIQKATGCCIGLSRGDSPMPYCHCPYAYADVVAAIVANAVVAFPDFQYTSIQVNIGLASTLHVDSGNMGPSLIIALGPFTGGQVWTHRAAEGNVLSVHNWTMMNGNVPHRTLPYTGDRLSIVLFTHAAAASQKSAAAMCQVRTAGIPAPPHPACHIPHIDDLKYINMGIPAASRAFNLLCESTVELAVATMVPKAIDESLATQEEAKKMVDARSIWISSPVSPALFVLCRVDPQHFARGHGVHSSAHRICMCSAALSSC